MARQEVLLNAEPLGAREEKTISPLLDVSKSDRLHLHFSAGRRSIAGLNVRIVFGTLVGDLRIHADSTVWFEDTVSEREFSHTVPDTYSGAGFVMSVPVIVPELVSVILRNNSREEIETLYVTLLAQEF